MAIKILSDIVTVVSEHIANPSTPEYDIFVGLEHYDAGEPVITRYGSTAQLESSVKHFNEGDILVARRNVYLKRAGVVKFEGVTSGDSIVLRVKDERYKAIIPFLLNTEEFWDYAEQNSDGTMSKRLAPDVLLEYECDIPDNHKEIADKLWAAYELKEAYKKMIAATDEMVKTQFNEMFGADTPKQKISEVCDVRGGSTPSRTNSLFWDNGDVPWFTVDDIYSQGKYIRETKQHITKLATKKCFVYPIDTVVICCTASIGECALAKIEMASNQQFNGMMIKDRNKLDPQFLLYVSSTLKEELLRQAGKTTIHFVSRNKLEEMQIPVPSMDKQQRFVAIMEQADKSKYFS